MPPLIVGTWKEVQPAVGLSEPGVQGRSIGEATGKGPAFSRAAWPDPETLGIILIRDVRRLRQVGTVRSQHGLRGKLSDCEDCLRVAREGPCISRMDKSVSYGA